MLAIIGGLVTACLWSSTLLASARASRLIGSWATLGWVMLVGIILAVPAVLITAPSPVLSSTDVIWLVVAGVSNSAGLMFVYTALQRGKVVVVGPIVSTEGAIGATIAILAGDPVGAATMVLLAVIAVGVVLAAIERTPEGPIEASLESPSPERTSSAAVTAGIAIVGALLFGLNLFATSRLADSVPLAWTVLPARFAGFVGVTIPLLAMRRLTLVRAAVPFVLLIGIAEVVGIATYAIAATDSAPVASVISSQFAAIAAIVSFLFFGERLTRLQTAGVVTIVAGVTALAISQAA